MSELRDILAGVIGERLTFTGDTVTNLRNGKTFTAELEEVPDIELTTELGRDPREQVILHVADRAAVALQVVNDRCQVLINGQTVVLQLIRRSDNAVSLQTDFYCQKVTPQDL